MGRFIRGAGVLGALAASVAGCAQIAGIDETSGIPPTGVSVTIDRLSVGSTLVRAAQDVTGQTATYLESDPAMIDGLARTPAEQADVNVWTAAIPDGAPPVVFTLPDDAGARLWALGARDVVGLHAVYEHPSPAPAPVPAMLAVQANLPSGWNGTESFELYSVGTWARRTLTAPVTLGAVMLGPETLDYASFSSLVGRPLTAITLDDSHAVLRYDAAALTGVLEVAPFAQTGNDSVTGTMVAVPRDQALSATVAPATLPTRFVTQLPAMTETTMAWAVRAAPGAAAGFELGPALVSGALDTTSPTTLTAMFGNPFAGKGWPAVFVLAASARRTYTDPASMLPVTLEAQMVNALPATMVAAGEAVDVPAGMPQLVAFDATPLTTDGQLLPRPTLAPVITFTTDRPGASLYELQVFQLRATPAATALERVLVLSALGVESVFTVPPELFEPGATYVIRAGAYAGGYPGAASGDLTQRSLPLSRTFYDSGAFTVTP